MYIVHTDLQSKVCAHNYLITKLALIFQLIGSREANELKTNWEKRKQKDKKKRQKYPHSQIKIQK